MSIEIRPAAAEDAERLLALDSYAQINPQRRTQIAVWIEAGQCFLADRDGAAVGYCVLTRAFFNSFFIELLMVDGTERRSGIGTRMIRHVADQIPPGEKLWTSTNQSNAPMRALLARLSFVESGRIDNLDEGDPELVFVRLPIS
jgi:ribosomal protein S18 acetylase RimI-like enzyme